jgi:hypothetical protein
MSPASGGLKGKSSVVLVEQNHVRKNILDPTEADCGNTLTRYVSCAGEGGPGVKSQSICTGNMALV